MPIRYRQNYKKLRPNNFIYRLILMFNRNNLSLNYKEVYISCSFKQKASKMKNYKIVSIFTLLGILLANLLTSCTASLNNRTKETITQEYEIKQFDKIKLNGAFNVELSQNDTSRLVIKTTQHHHDNLKIHDRNNTLSIESKLKHITSNEIKLFITFDKIESMEIEGGVNLNTTGYLIFEDFKIDVEGGANINMELTANQLSAKAEGGVNMDLKGRVNYFKIATEGASNIDADHLKAERVKCSVTGVGNASVYATEQLDAYLEGLGKIGYRGNPKINKQVNGIGVIYKK